MGKTTTAYLVSKELGYDVMEMNASDTRSKKLLEAAVADAMSSQSLSQTSKKRVRFGSPILISLFYAFSIHRSF